MMRSWLPLILVILLISAGLWFSESPPEQFLGKRPTPQQQNRAADLIIKGAETRRFDQAGNLAYRVDAEQITYFQFKRRDRANLKEPRMLFYTDDQPKWATRSKRGVAFNRGKRIVLSGDVQIDELPGPNGIQLETPRITIFPDREFAETDKVVTISSGPNRTEGTGMRAYLKENRMEILSDVKSSYDTQ
ncbi:LPS export ABC transporter periplasmic protein LptC [Microbulbifer sp. TRSA007]|uniref:LPS export ABC transporter periplasmic protein LptC n=1 Tax=Microbulbifer sp. TRSA007 TaxID=3243384 RepID=UPI0040394983